MALDQNIDSDGLESMDDTTGLLEIQKSMEAIEKLINNPEGSSDEPNDNLEVEESTEEKKDDSEDEESSKEDSSEESEESEETEKKEKKTDKYRKLQNDKYRALAEKAAAEERIKELEQMLNESMSSGTYHYGKNVYADLDKAKEAKRKALREGDEDAYLEADMALIKAINTVTDLEKWASESKAPPKVAPLPRNENVDLQIKQEMAMDWLDNHSYLQPTSRNYDSNLASKVAEFVNYLDDNLEKKNQKDIYYTPAYFNTIDDYIGSIKTTKKTSNIEARPTVGGVRNSYAGQSKSSSSKTQVTLTADEKTMAMVMGVDEKEWVKYKEEEMKNRKKA